MSELNLLRFANYYNLLLLHSHIRRYYAFFTKSEYTVQKDVAFSSLFFPVYYAREVWDHDTSLATKMGLEHAHLKAIQYLPILNFSFVSSENRVKAKLGLPTMFEGVTGLQFTSFVAQTY